MTTIKISAKFCSRTQAVMFLVVYCLQPADKLCITQCLYWNNSWKIRLSCNSFRCVFCFSIFVCVCISV